MDITRRQNLYSEFQELKEDPMQPRATLLVAKILLELLDTVTLMETHLADLSDGLIEEETVLES